MHVMPIRPQSAKDNPWAGCLTKLEKREIDVAMLPVRTLPARFEGRTLYQEDFVVAMRNGHPFARAPGIAAFCASQHLLVSFSSDPHGFVDELLEKQGRKRRIVLSVPSFMMALAHIANSDLLAVLPRRLVQQYATQFGLVCAELPLRRKPDPIRAVATKAAAMDAGIAWLTQLLCDVFAPERHRDAGA
jgi:DNA-binding transcriptional LysR family regulator